MSISYSKNIAANKIIGNLNKTNNSLQSTFEKLSSGQRINRASDDAAGLAIAESLKNESRVLKRGNQNLQDGISLLNVAESSVSELINITSRISELAQQAANGTYSTAQRKVINAEAQALSEEFTRISTTTEFNDKKLFDGSIDDGISLQAGFGEQAIIKSSLGGVKGDGTFSLLSSYSQTNGAIVETA
ncbi:UNVERIFIED_CONTAM: hypothetical protein GTU68_064493, partial [Idotea baltica]|nr:hypothetical protein [Idotea baltica]